MYRNLPTKGSLILNGALPPNADDTSTDTNWCIDAREDLDTPISGFRGSPKKENPYCDGPTCTADEKCATASCDLTMESVGLPRKYFSVCSYYPIIGTSEALFSRSTSFGPAMMAIGRWTEDRTVSSTITV